MNTMKSIVVAIFLFFVTSSVVEAKMIRGGIETTLIENNDGRSVMSYDSRTRIGHRSRRLEDEEQDPEQGTVAANFSSMSKAATIWTILLCLWILFWIGAICFSCCDNSLTKRSASTTSSNDTSNNNDSKGNLLLGEAATDNDNKGDSKGERKNERSGKHQGRGKRGRPKLRMFGRNMIEFKAFRPSYFVVFDGTHFHREGNQSNITKEQHQQQQQQQYIRD